MARIKHADLWRDAAIAVVVFALSLGLLAVGDAVHDEDKVNALSVALTALASLPVIGRRRSPLAVFTLTGLASAALRLVAAPAGPPLGPTIALYGVGQRGTASRAAQWRVAALVVTVLAAHVTAVGLGTDAFPGYAILFGVVVWGGAWLAGDRTRMRRERMAGLEERARRAEREAERERKLAAAEQRASIARDLHDSAGHAINVILVHAGLGRLQVERDPAAARQAFETIEEVARETVGEIDQMVRVLRENGPNGVEPPPGVAALDNLVQRQRAAGLDVAVRLRGDRRPLPASVDQAAYRIVQEALTNAARHGDGPAEVQLAFEAGALAVTVTNPLRRDGAVSAGNGHGVAGMHERAALLGGTLRAGASDGRFEVRARLPT
jgi:signal transduction histidine kinase